MGKIQMVSDVPHMIEKWDHEKNTTDPNQIRANSQRDVCHWKCKKCGYEWESTSYKRFISTGKCLCCESNRVVVKGINDLLTVHEEATKLYDFEKNKTEGIDVYALSPASHTRVYWKCAKCGYSWKTSVKAQEKTNFRCPCCDTNKRINAGVNDVLTVVEGLTDFYDFEKNAGFDIYSEGVGSRKSVFWKCKECGRSWKASIASRVSRENGKHVAIGCSHEDSKMVSECPDLMRFWDAEKNTLDPFTTPSYSHQQAFWRCKTCEHTWTSTINGRQQGTGKCPCCELNLVTKQGVNDFLTLVPEARKTYDFEKNKDIDIYNQSVSSATLVWWKCEKCGLEWQSTIVAHVQGSKALYNLRGCPRCQRRGKNIKHDVASDPTLMRFWDFEKNEAHGLDPKTLAVNSLVRAFWKCKDCGYEWETQIHSRKMAENQCPCCEALKATGKGFNDVLTVVPEFAQYYDFERNKDIDIHSFGIRSQKSVYFKCDTCGHKWHAPISHQITMDDEGNYHFIGCAKCAFWNANYAIQYPELDAMYNKKLNGVPLSAVSPADARVRKYWWDCPTCGRPFEAWFYNMALAAKNAEIRECPYCVKGKAVEGISFAETHPELMDEYAPENTIDPFKEFPSSRQYVKWICRNNSLHTWEAPFIYRHNGYGNCPYCDGKRILPGFNSFATKHTNLLEEWDYVANYLLADPDRIGEGCTISVWWKCPKSTLHKYTMSPKQKLMFQKRHRESCPYCKGLRRKKRYFV